MTGDRSSGWRRAIVAAAVLAAASFSTSPRAAATGADWNAISAEAVALLRQYIRIPSVNPPADTRATAAFLEEILEKEGIEVRTFESTPGKVNLLARLRAASPAGRPLLLLHHMDVVPVDASRWPVDPFGAEMKDDQIYGRGAADMKGVGVLHLLAFLTLKRQSIPLSRDVLLLATADEETGGLGGARWMIEHQWSDLDPEYVLDEGGFGARDVLAADGRLVFSVAVGEKKMMWVKLTATGTAGHGSQPTEDNPNDLLAGTLESIQERVRAKLQPRQGPVVRELTARVGSLADNKFTRAIQRDTVSLTTLRSGLGDPPKVNVIPSVAEATFDCRLLPDTDSGRFLDEILLAGAPRSLKAEVLYRMDDTPVTPHDTPLFSALEDAIRQEHPGAVVAPTLIPYGTDSNAFRVKGAKAYGIIPMVLDGAIIASMHSDAERVPAAELGRGVRILYNTLRKMAEKIP
jgi:acetylornithine deacetylase/succinyl-diaminopimelate desuccinylase-like protein